MSQANEMLKSKPFFREWERLGNVTLLLEPFTVENGLLTMTLKVKRDSVIKRYSTFLHPPPPTHPYRFSPSLQMDLIGITYILGHIIHVCVPRSLYRF